MRSPKIPVRFDSYVYGFTLQEVSWPFDPEERPDVAATLQPQVAPDEYPNLTEMMRLMMRARIPSAARKGTVAYESEFEFGLDLILDGLEGVRRE